MFAAGALPLACIPAIALAPLLLRAAEPERPKYGPAAVRLYDRRDYIQRHPAPDFWALIPYYAPQHNDSSCSVASVAMLANALRANRALGANDELATPSDLLDRVQTEAWPRKVAADGPGVTLDELGRIVPAALRAYGLPDVRAEVIRFDGDARPTKMRLRELLVQNERSDRDFILVNFLQSRLTGDPAGAVGHIAPVAAYDAKRCSVLLLDPDRRWYEPYWVSEDALLEAMNTIDPVSNRSRGLIRITH